MKIPMLRSADKPSAKLGYAYRFMACRVAMAIVSLLIIALPSRSADLVVTNAADVADGDVSSPDALLRKPGADGISLREAIQACNNAVGPHSITFDPSLAGRTISLTTGLWVTRNGVSVTGNFGSDGKLGITLDISSVNSNSAIELTASDFSLQNIRVRVSGPVNPRFGFAIYLNASGPQLLTNVRILGNEFLGNGRTQPFSAVFIGHQHVASAMRISDIIVVGNTFSDLRGENDGVHIAPEGRNCVIANVQIAQNYFANSDFPVELVHTNGGTGNIIQGTRIVQNTFVGNQIGVAFGSATNPPMSTVSGNSTVDTLISENIFTNNVNHINVWSGGFDAQNNQTLNTRITRNTFSSGGVSITLGSGQTGSNRPAISGNKVDNTVITENVFSNNYQDLWISCGGNNVTSANRISNTLFDNNLVTGSKYKSISFTSGTGDSYDNHIENVWIINNTIVGELDRSQFAINGTVEGPGNTISGLKIINTIFWKNAGGDLGSLVAPGDVQFCITSDTRFSGAYGNIAADPRFVDAAKEDYHLAEGSRAIDAGTSDGAPETDLDGRSRYDNSTTPNAGMGAAKYYDIGAYEYYPVPPVNRQPSSQTGIIGSR
jgi:hypothetical protein